MSFGPWGWPYGEQVSRPQDPTDRPLQPGDPIDPNTTLYIVAQGPHIGAIGTHEALSLVEGRVLLEEGTAYDPETYPDLARFLAPLQGQNRVPIFSKPEWL